MRRMILNKRIKREIKKDLVKNLALFFLITIGVGCIISIAGATDSIVYTVEKCNEANVVEDGEFEVFVPLTNDDKTNIENLGAEIQENFYLEYNMENSSQIRVFKNRKKINCVDIEQGKQADIDNEIVLEKHYAESNKYSIGDNISIGDEEFVVTGVGSCPDYNLVKKNVNDVSSDTSKFSVAFVSEEGYKRLYDANKMKNGQQYSYNYKINTDLVDDDLEDYISNLNFNVNDIKDEYMKEVINKSESSKNELSSGVKQLADGSKELTDGIDAFKNSTNELKSGSLELSEGTDEYESGINKLYNGLNTLNSSSESLVDGANRNLNAVFALVNAQLNEKGINVTLTSKNYKSELEHLANKSSVLPKNQIAQLLQMKSELDEEMKFYNGINQYAQSVAQATSGAEELKNNFSKLKDGTGKINNGNSEVADKSTELYTNSLKLTEGTENLRNSVDKIIEENFEFKYENLISFIKALDNSRINDYKDDSEINKNAAVVVGIFIFILIAYIISVYVINTVEEESKIIGALYSLGYLKKELIQHFMIIPVIISLTGGIIGTIAGFLAVDFQAEESIAHYSYPTLEKVYPIYLVIYGVVLPVVVTIVVNYLTLNKRLAKNPLQLLKKEQKGNTQDKMNLKHIGFINKFRLRQYRREIRGNLILFVGLFISVILMIQAFTIYSSITNLKKNINKDVNFDYMYSLKFPEENCIEGGEEGYLETLSSYCKISGGDLDVSLQGIINDSSYFDIDVSGMKKDEVYVSTSAQQKFGWKKGDMISLSNHINHLSYSFKVKDVVPYSNGIYVFMNLDSMREVFNQKNKYYNVVFSSTELEINNGRIFSITTKDDIKRTAQLFMDTMSGLITLVLVVSIILFSIVMYLLLKVMIDKSKLNISLLKIFGYKDSEIRRIYIDGNFLTVLLVLAIGIPVGKKIVDLIYPYLVANVASGSDCSLSLNAYLLMIGIVLLNYLIISLLINLKLKKISFVEILKDRE